MSAAACYYLCQTRVSGSPRDLRTMCLLDMDIASWLAGGFGAAGGDVQQISVALLQPQEVVLENTVH